MGIHDNDTYRSLLPQENGDGTVDLTVYANETLTAKTGYAISMGTVGWRCDGLVPSASFGAAYIGFPRGTMASGDVGRLQIGGYLTGAILGASITGTAGSAVEWILATLTSAAEINDASSTSFSHFGVFATANSTSVATTVHDILLYPIRVQCNA